MTLTVRTPLKFKKEVIMLILRGWSLVQNVNFMLVWLLAFFTSNSYATRLSSQMIRDVQIRMPKFWYILNCKCMSNRY